ncbi:hypothetical protein RIVM261_087510 [Rivularia sp. IAM M-261]|nr:hypothetical protein CAL7716_091720 [Calothrix sp. PCC 7716]GJD23795.1 hypothetical protein RIVM261_087510 [Rivularia sp. IAM M-261]
MFYNSYVIDLHMDRLLTTALTQIEKQVLECAHSLTHFKTEQCIVYIEGIEVIHLFLVHVKTIFSRLYNYE